MLIEWYCGKSSPAPHLVPDDITDEEGWEGEVRLVEIEVRHQSPRFWFQRDTDQRLVNFSMRSAWPVLLKMVRGRYTGRFKWRKSGAWNYVEAEKDGD